MAKSGPEPFLPAQSKMEVLSFRHVSHVECTLNSRHHLFYTWRPLRIESEFVKQLQFCCDGAIEGLQVGCIVEIKVEDLDHLFTFRCLSLEVISMDDFPDRTWDPNLSPCRRCLQPAIYETGKESALQLMWQAFRRFLS